MKKTFALVLLALLLPTFTGCAGCGCRERLRDCFRRGAICGSRTTPVATAPAPIVYTQPAPVQQYVQPQYTQPQIVQPPAPAPIVQAPAPRVIAPQYAAPAVQCCPPCVPCCPPVYQECCPSYDSCGCGGTGYSVGSPVYEGEWMSSGNCCSGGYDGAISAPERVPTQANPDSSTDPGPST